MVLVQFLQQHNPYMIRVCLYLKRDLHRNILNKKLFSDIWLIYWNTNFDISSIRSWFSYLFKFKGQKNRNIENFDNVCLCVCVYVSLCAHILEKISRRKNLCEPTYIFIRIHLVSIAHIARKISRTKIPCESTSTGPMNSLDIAHRWIHPRIHLSMAMSGWQ